MSLQKLNAEFAPAPVRALLVDMDGVKKITLYFILTNVI